MNYASGVTVMVGDKVDLGQGQVGEVVGIIQERHFSVGYNISDWAHLETGLLINTKFGDLRMETPDEDLELISRVGSNLEMHG
jgi:hypothetical protein